MISPGRCRLRQNRAIGVHSWVIAGLGMGIQLDESPAADKISMVGGSAKNLEVSTMLSLRINQKTYSVGVESETPLLWVIRDTIGLTGTKYGCGIAMCGAGTVHVSDKATRSCMTQVGRVAGQEIITIEGLGGTHP